MTKMNACHDMAWSSLENIIAGVKCKLYAIFLGKLYTC